MDAMQGQAMAQASQRRREDQLRRIAAALARIDSGDYGYCLDCDEEIARGRLESDPAVMLCIHCASQREVG
jgi:DnaK suppressor protein